jgi:Ser/Thr protein kinase RdoA (MazF antagonist)
MLQLACAWNLAHDPVACVAPTLIQETGAGVRAIEAKRAELAAVPAVPVLSADEVAQIRAIGDNTGSMALKGAAPDFEGDPLPDRWPISDELSALAGRWGIDPRRDLARAA